MDKTRSKRLRSYYIQMFPYLLVSLVFSATFIFTKIAWDQACTSCVFVPGFCTLLEVSVIGTGFGFIVSTCFCLYWLGRIMGVFNEEIKAWRSRRS